MGTLYVVATPIGNLDDMTPRAIRTLGEVSLIAAEDTRHTANLLRRFDISTPTISYHQHNEQQRTNRLLAALRDGDVALVTDAGTPAVSDPGMVLVRAAREAGHRVMPIPGVSSLATAVSASGLIDGPFLFHGFLPRAGEERRAALGRLVASRVPVVLFESPNRLIETLGDLQVYFGDVRAVVARELTKIHEEIRDGRLSKLASHFEQGEVKGEICIIVDSVGAASEGIAVDVSALAQRLIADGLKPSRAARELARIADIPSTEAYEAVRNLRNDGASEG